MIKNPKLLTKSFLRSFAILGGVGLVIHIAIYLTFPFYYIQLEGEKFNESATIMVKYLEGKKIQELPSLLESYSKSLRRSAHLKDDVLDKRISLVHDLEIKEGSPTSYIVTIDRQITTADGKKVTIQFIQGVDIYKEATRIMFLYLPYTFLATLVFAFLFSYFYTKRLLEPLFYISKITSKMQELDHNIRFNEMRKDEVGEVGKQINDVYENLLRVIDESERRNERIVRLQNQKVSFVRGASHELKTPLASLRIILENMQYNIGDYKDHPKYIARSINTIDQMSHLLEEVLESSKFQEWTECRETLTVKTVLVDILSRYQELAHSRGVTIENQLTDATRVSMSLKALDKVLTNLISNAIKYSDQNGCVMISEQDGYLSIKNTCAPLSDQELEHLFDIFYHSQIVTDKAEGSGLGLYIVNNILESYQMDYSFLPYERGMEFKIDLQID
ncbi:sensor histidine kinase [Streptococcus pneumoniae]|uniref:histidine kinase n=1 Tax=Streptococcus pneumoniae TaxID=1313 RepID=A0AA86XEV1_STREE|nr:HAMP domain-containing histidine kinase [Streptococcus pneumoniae]MDG9598683.1 HAMP domain-containing histidine kinase [Streptococcus pneumoniae]MDG9604580.1 HAMP domain-containing histidine kinase [Streptococcus pneumoniae]CIP87869.1 sensor histidine kinase [Streptococcus pneumoniae]CIS22422.1 sensor histidine kinase [Streptococcus pneumoniae]